VHLVFAALAKLDTESIVIISSVLLACGSIGLISVNLTNPRLVGLGWLGLAFLSGGTGAFLIAISSRTPRFFGIVLPGFLIILSFVLLQVAVLALRRVKNILPRFGAVLLLIQLTGDLWLTYIFPYERGRVSLLGLLVAAQVVQTIILLVREAKQGARLPAWLSAAILMALIGVNLLRSFLLLCFPEMTYEHHAALYKVVSMVYLITAIGLAFNFFWITTAELTSELEKMAGTDPLTRVYNRRVFLEWCEHELLRSQRDSRPFSLLMMDLDHFKEINDRYGHHGGDVMLCAVVEAVQDSVRGIDVLGRWGGEEFVALLPGANGAAALLVAQRVRSNIERLILPTEVKTPGGMNEMMRMTMSVGVATYRGDNDGLDAMFRRADEALYGAKAAGRNRVLATL
jgi:diguanylate cyclase (GGDEF)-like protein